MDDKNLTHIALFASLISASCFVQFPLPPAGIPIVIQDMMCMLSGMLLGPVHGALAVVIFLILGSLGLPVFSGKGGIQCFVGPTCGVLFSYPILAFAGGLILAVFLSNKKEHSKIKSLIVISIAAIVATVIMFACAIFGFMCVTQSGFKKAVAAILLPFIPGNIIKIIVMVPLTYKFRPILLRNKTSE